jgi:hypothetical protein
VARVVAVHGIGRQVEGESLLHQAWFPAMRDGVRFAGGDIAPDDLRCVAYGQVFRPPGRTLSTDVPVLTAGDVAEGFDQELLALWWAQAARVDEQVIAPDVRSLARAPSAVQAALRALSGSEFFAGLALRALVFDLHQVRRYLTEPQVRTQVLERVAQAVSADTRVIVAHSLGSVAAYEALCANPRWPVRTLVTLGSPLGIGKLVFDRLQPSPSVGGQPRGAWPAPIEGWTNIVDAGDVVALVKDLRPLFGERVRGFVVHNGSHAHDVSPYLSAPETGAAILSGGVTGGTSPAAGDRRGHRLCAGTAMEPAGADR